LADQASTRETGAVPRRSPGPVFRRV